MVRLSVFNTISLDGYFTGENNDLSWAHANPNDAEWNEFVSANAQGDGALLLGRVTYDMMAGWWPTPQAMEMMPEVAEGMNRMRKYVFSRTLKNPTWSNTTVLTGDLADETRKLKQTSDQGIVILGSGTIIAQLAPHRLIDAYQIVIKPVVLGQGRTMFEGLQNRLNFERTDVRMFKNGNVVISYGVGVNA